MKTIEGDLIELAKNGTFDVIIHGCNCFNAMGAGVAAAIAANFPEAAKADRATGYGDSNKLGKFSTAVVEVNGRNLSVINAYTQYYFGHLHKALNYEIVRECFRRIADEIRINRRGSRIGYPAIGAGLGKGQWSIISKIIDEEFEGLDHTLVIFMKHEDLSESCQLRLGEPK